MGTTQFLRFLTPGTDFNGNDGLDGDDAILYSIPPGPGVSIDFFNYQYVLKTGMKFHDLDADGIKDDNEGGLGGWTIEALQGGVVVDSTTTADDGTYSFSLKPGTYTFQEVLKDDWYQSYPADSTYTETLVSGIPSPDNDFGNYVNGSIHGFKFDDTNGDGVFNGSDIPQVGVVFTLSGNGITPITDSTDASGSFDFTNLKPGTYTVTETPPGALPPYQSEVVVGNQLTFGNFEQKVCALTPGFWSQHLWAWDGNPNTDGPVDKQGRTLASKLVAAGTLTDEDMLEDNATGLYLDDRLFFSLKDAQDIINAGSKIINDDQRAKLARHAIATQLNDFNGAPNPNNILKNATDWLTGIPPYKGYTDGSTGNVDIFVNGKRDGIADFNNTEETGADGFLGTKLAAKKQAWQGDPAGTNAGSEIFNA